MTLTRRLLVELGETTVLDLIDRERSLSSARLSLAGNKRDLANAYIALRVALGIGHEDVAEVVSRDAIMSMDDVVTE